MHRRWIVEEHTDRARRQSRATLSEVESKAILSRYGIPVVEEAVVETEEQAAAAARKIGYPAVL